MNATAGHLWRAEAASCKGAAHVAAGTPNQDAYATLAVADVTAVAVADGHGDPAHFRSNEGSRLAVDLAVALMVDEAMAGHDADSFRAALHEELRPRLLIDWRESVLEHAESFPFSEERDGHPVGSGEQAILRTYGTTLIAIVATPTVIGFAQIGDGDAIVVFADGDVVRPLPKDPNLDGLHTTSLSQSDAANSFRVTALDLTARQLSLAMAVTDGFAAPQVDGVGWWRQVGDELATHLKERGSDWIHEKLPGWLEEPAQTGGDDTTMGLLLNHYLEASNSPA